jgi:hypothetical protein
MRAFGIITHRIDNVVGEGRHEGGMLRAFCVCKEYLCCMQFAVHVRVTNSCPLAI